MKTLQESILDKDFDAPEMPSADFPGAGELIDILDKHDWKPYGNSDKDPYMTYTYYGIICKHTNETFYADLKDWIYKFGKKSKSGLYNLGAFVPDNYVNSKFKKESTIKINLFDYGRAGLIRSILATVKYGEEELSIQQPVPRSKYNYYVHEFAGELIEWFIKNESSK